MVKSFSFFFLLIPAFTIAQLTYHQDIAPIIKKHCISCHQKGDIGPMPLTSYEEVASYASMIKYVTTSKLMPPFKADHYKVSYQNERKVTLDEINIISEWIDSGLNKGEELKTQYKNSNKNESDYDYYVCMNESFEHYGIYYDQFQAFVLPIDLPEDKVVDQIVFEPGNKEIVRSAGISLSHKGDALAMDQWDPRYGYYAYGNIGFNAQLPLWYSWMPHTPSLLLNKDESLFLPKNSELILHLHYGPYGEIQKDSSCLYFNFSKIDFIPASLQNIPLILPSFSQDSFVIQKDKKQRKSSSFYIPTLSHLKSVTPVSHLLCRSWEMFAVLPDKSSIPLLSIEDWDFHWKEKYIFEEPIILPPGSRIITNVIYDNTTENPFNPADPPINMYAGLNMFNENFTCYFEFVSPEEQQAYFTKSSAVIENQNESLKINVNREGRYTCSLYDMTNQHQSTLISKRLLAGNHTLKSSFIPKVSGRYALILSSDDTVHDTWFFVVP